MITAPEPTTQAWTTPLSTVAPTTSNAPASRNLGHQRVGRVRVRRPGLRRAGLLAGAAGRPSSPGAAGRPSRSPGFDDLREPERWDPRLTLVREIMLTREPEVAEFPLALRL